MKGVRHDPETDTWSAYTYWHGHCYHVGTYHSREQAQAAYEAELRTENPDFHPAPARVERAGVAAELSSRPCPSRTGVVAATLT